MRSPITSPAPKVIEVFGNPEKAPSVRGQGLFRLFEAGRWRIWPNPRRTAQSVEDDLTGGSRGPSPSHPLTGCFAGDLTPRSGQMQSQDDISLASENSKKVHAGNLIETVGETPTKAVENSQSRNLSEPLKLDSPTNSRTTESERGPREPTTENENWSAENLMCNGVPDSFQFIKMGIALSRAEVMFVLDAEYFGIEHAVTLARAFNRKCERPLEVINKITGGNFSLS
jgi:hypothetical protein